MTMLRLMITNDWQLEMRRLKVDYWQFTAKEDFGDYRTRVHHILISSQSDKLCVCMCATVTDPYAIAQALDEVATPTLWECATETWTLLLADFQSKISNGIVTRSWDSGPDDGQVRPLFQAGHWVQLVFSCVEQERKVCGLRYCSQPFRNLRIKEIVRLLVDTSCCETKLVWT